MATSVPSKEAKTVPKPKGGSGSGARIACGIPGILNFAPVQLAVPSDVVVKSVNMALELETLSFALANR